LDVQLFYRRQLVLDAAPAGLAVKVLWLCGVRECGLAAIRQGDAGGLEGSSEMSKD